MRGERLAQLRCYTVTVNTDAAPIPANRASSPQNLTREKLALSAVIALAMLLYTALLTNGMAALGSDWAMYVMHARNLATGQPYGSTFFVYQPEAATYGAATYPTGYSLFLAPIYAICGINIRVFKVLTDLLLALSLGPIYFFLRRYLEFAASLLLAGALSFSGPYLLLQDTIGSEALYLLLSFSALVFLTRTYDSQRDRSAPWRSGATAGVLLAAVEITRPVGLALILAVLVYEAVRRRRPTRFAAGILAVVVPVLALNSLLAHKDASYAEQFVISIPHAVRSLSAYAGGFSYLFTNPLSNWLRYALWLACSLLALVGLATTARKVNPLPALYAAFTLGVLALYWMPNMRYLTPLYPIYLLFAALGCAQIVRLAPLRWMRTAQAAAAAGILLAPALSVAAARPSQDTLITDPHFKKLTEVLRTTSGPRDLTIFWNARVLALAASRPSSAYPRLSDEHGRFSPETLLRYFDHVHPAYIVYDADFAEQEPYVLDAIARAPARFAPVYANARFRLFRYNATPAAR